MSIPTLNQVVRSDHSPVYLSKSGEFYSVWLGQDWMYFSQVMVRQTQDEFSLNLEECAEKEDLPSWVDTLRDEIVCESLFSYAKFFKNRGRDENEGISLLLDDLRRRLSRVTEANLFEALCWIVQLSTDLERYKIRYYTSLTQLGEELRLLIDACYKLDFIKLK